MSSPDPNRIQETLVLLQSIKRRLRRLTVAVVLLVLVVVLLTASVFGYLVDYMAYDPMLWGGSTAGAAVLGFAFGWFAGRRA